MYSTTHACGKNSNFSPSFLSFDSSSRESALLPRALPLVLQTVSPSLHYHFYTLLFGLLLAAAAYSS